MEKKARLKEIDVIKGLTITMVVLGHTNISHHIETILSGFRMPLFFLAAGFVVSTNKYIDHYHQFVISKLWRLVVPYFTASALLFGFWFIRFADDVSPWLAVKDIFTGNNPRIGAPLWFLPCLFSAELIFLGTLIITKSAKHPLTRWGVFLALSFAGVFIGRIVQIPWNLDIALAIQLFMYFGYDLKTRKLYREYCFPKWMILASLIIFPTAVTLNGEIGISMRSYNNVFLFFIAGLTGCILIMSIVRYLVKIKGVSPVFTYIGQHSLTILLYHTVIIFIFVRATHIHVQFIQLVVGMSLALALDWLLRKLPIAKTVFLGERSSKKSGATPVLSGETASA
ncbi:acyltransferase family protein [Gorillibacterium massiliense]|uniref:acyltransferase family protein n=1 Tax=Gorillibacterium massiliense TaxID=1280390 RepID=UPI0004B1C93C|nr:acyltransferase family protein [Gorillibacterium massiliense]